MQADTMASEQEHFLILFSTSTLLNQIALHLKTLQVEHQTSREERIAKNSTEVICYFFLFPLNNLNKASGPFTENRKGEPHPCKNSHQFHLHFFAVRILD